MLTNDKMEETKETTQPQHFYINSLSFYHHRQQKYFQSNLLDMYFTYNWLQNINIIILVVGVGLL